MGDTEEEREKSYHDEVCRRVRCAKAHYFSEECDVGCCCLRKVDTSEIINQQKKPDMPLMWLPPEVHWCILRKLTTQQFIGLCTTCKLFYSYSTASTWSDHFKLARKRKRWYRESDSCRTDLKGKFDAVRAILEQFCIVVCKTAREVHTCYNESTNSLRTKEKPKHKTHPCTCIDRANVSWLISSSSSSSSSFAPSASSVHIYDGPCGWGRGKVMIGPTRRRGKRKEEKKMEEKVENMTKEEVDLTYPMSVWSTACTRSPWRSHSLMAASCISRRLHRAALLDRIDGCLSPRWSPTGGLPSRRRLLSHRPPPCFADGLPSRRPPRLASRFPSPISPAISHLFGRLPSHHSAIDQAAALAGTAYQECRCRGQKEKKQNSRSYSISWALRQRQPPDGSPPPLLVLNRGRRSNLN